MADPLDLLTGTIRPRQDETWTTLASLAQAVASIPERRARAAAQRAEMEAQQLNAQTRAGELQYRQQALQQQDAAKAKMAQMDQAVNAIVSQAMVEGPDGVKRFDRKRIMEGFARVGAPLDVQAHTLKALDDVEDSGSKLEEARRDHAARVLNAVIEAPDTEQAAMMGIATGKANGWLKDAEAEPLMALFASGQDPKPRLKQLRDTLSDKYREKEQKLGPGDVIARGDKVLLQAPFAPKAPTEASLAVEAAGGDPSKALSLMNQPAPLSPYQAAQLNISRGQLSLAQQREAREAAKPQGADKPPTGQQRRALGFFNRAKQADDDVQALENQVSKLGLVGTARMKYLWNPLQSDTGQKYNQAQRAFTEARLRKDSGAAIPEHEYENDRKTYFAEPGDGPAALEQKRRARAALIASLGSEAGAGALHEFYGDEGDTLVQDYRSRAAKGGTTGFQKVEFGPNGELRLKKD